MRAARQESTRPVVRGARRVGAFLRTIVTAGGGPAATAHSVRAWSAFLLVGIFGWLGVLVLGSPRARRRWLGRCARTGFRLAGVPVSCRGPGIAAGPGVVVSNHASYLDVVVLTAVLPDSVCYVAKRELDSSPLLSWFLRRTGTHFVDRHRPRGSAADLGAMKEAVRGGACLLFFPEGTFVNKPGLLPFRLGAFSVAADTGAPLYPVALSGTRTVLSPAGWTVARGGVTVTIFPPVARSPGEETPGQEIRTPGARGQASRPEAVDLKERARGAVLSACGEPDAPGPVLGVVRGGTA